jgi:hypothetical protein
MPRRRGSARGVASADASIVFPSHCFGRPSFPQAGFDPLAYHCALKLSERAGDLENELAHKRCRVDGLLTRRYKSTPQASRCLIGSRKSLSDRPRRSIAPISNFRRITGRPAPMGACAPLFRRRWCQNAVASRIVHAPLTLLAKNDISATDGIIS